ncbi:MAG: CRISPR-associated endonuclease Cas2 [Candidatus Diapherotrites archaeon]|nr:CRISPR-associated endonuclease Cas2 [Candidatus Diapherotrites archaeon]
MTSNNLFVISYDIPDDRRRFKIANILKSYGERVQYSVFECWLNQAELNRLIEELEDRIELDVDSVRMYKSVSDVRVLGVGTVTKDPHSWII